MSYDDKVMSLINEGHYRYGSDISSIANFLRKKGELALRTAQSQYDEKIFEVYQNLGLKLIEEAQRLH